MSAALKLLIALAVLGATGVGGCLVCAGLGAKGIADADTNAKKIAADGRAKATSIAAASLLAAYKANEVKADADFKGKYLRVSGVVGDVKKDITDNAYVTVGTGEAFELPIVQCLLIKDSVGRAASLSKGEAITATGRVEGLMGNVILRDCDF